ncbi:hypothetical protein LB572_31720 [Mesorhizobium sp. BH1-1-5]|uniref:hypothetical protein n=1 Tax=Mesorhizobium sp. BH1-1-5 TaxID=2876661 RepID=UPI001CCE6C24|nr:hypothetical protein [Mesorhizobium sp. BH1-1-5]MBZ9991669.1 hypothetical protein [Mesorhizobium sp. BH1-1-5]
MKNFIGLTATVQTFSATARWVGLERTQTNMPKTLATYASRAALLSVPIELAGDWGRMLPRSVKNVLERMRLACLDHCRLVSDRQPRRLRIEEHTSGPPAIWLHPDKSDMAWIIVDIGERDWSKLAYQFGHELGHVLANSWQAAAKPAAPCQWLEESMVEAFSLRGLQRLAAGWKKSPPFAGDSAFGDAIAEYRQNIIHRYAALANGQGLNGDVTAWFADQRREIEMPGLNPFAQAMCLTILAEYNQVPDCIEALGALNRWPGRSGIPIGEYLERWKESCAELQASQHLPLRLGELLGVVPRGR